MKKFIHNLKFSESGVRGILGQGLTPKLVCNLASAFGDYMGGGKIIIGRDTRSSGEMFEMAVCSGLLAVGCEVVNLGIVPTPTLQLMVTHLGGKGGIAITASHNGIEFNALKFIDGSGCFLDRIMAEELFDIYSQGEFNFVKESLLRSVEKFDNAFEIHTDKIFNSDIDIEAIRNRKLRVALDPCNGVGAIYSEKFLRELGCEVFAINSEADGNFRRTPEPNGECLRELAETVKKFSCDIGFAQDPDGDRLTIVDNNGRILSPHYTLALAVEHYLEQSECDNVVINFQTGKMVSDIIKSYGCNVVYAKVGEINSVEAMLKSHAEIGGEGNCGGVIYGKIHYGRDSFAAMALILEMLSVNQGATIAEIVGQLPKYYGFNDKFNIDHSMAKTVMEKLSLHFKNYDISRFDGLKIEFPTAWIVVRPSNTEQILRLQVESVDLQEAQKLFEELKMLINKIIDNE
ncbi:MAG: phosphoglucosamine mutase [Lentisphaeria bacterium]|nr:phosphoglucosamine mutase [Lentisphaeria bacterium]